MRARILFGIGGALSLAMAGWGMLWGVADVKAGVVEREVARWEEAGAVPEEVDLPKLLATAGEASALDPLNPEYTTLIGKIHEWQSVTRPVWSKEARQERVEAARWYRRTLALNPSDSVAWVSLAQTRFLNQEIDDETFGALERAGVFGAWEEVTQIKAAWIGMALWDHLPPSLREAHIRSVQRMFMYHKLVYQLTVMAYQFGWLEELRGLTTDPRAHEVIDRQVGWLEEGYHGNQH